MLYYEPITPERLKDFKNKLDRLNYLVNQKKVMIEKAALLKSVDFSKDKIKNTSNNHLSTPEIYTITLEGINKEIEDLKYHVFKTQSGGEYGLVEENKIISTQLERLKKPEYKTLLIKRYIEGQKHSVITYYFFCAEPDFLSNYQRYIEKEQDWHKAALISLEKVSEKPYLPLENVKQLVITGIEKC